MDRNPLPDCLSHLAQAYPPPSRALIAEISRLQAENADLKISVITFGAPWIVELAKDHGLPKGHLFPHHYDILAKAGARMVDFTRAEEP